MLALYDSDGKMTYITQTPYVGQKQYAFSLPAGSVSATEAMLVRVERHMRGASALLHTKN